MIYIYLWKWWSVNKCPANRQSLTDFVLLNSNLKSKQELQTCPFVHSHMFLSPIILSRRIEAGWTHFEVNHWKQWNQSNQIELWYETMFESKWNFALFTKSHSKLIKFFFCLVVNLVCLMNPTVCNLTFKESLFFLVCLRCVTRMLMAMSVIIEHRTRSKGIQTERLRVFFSILPCVFSILFFLSLFIYGNA